MKYNYCTHNRTHHLLFAQYLKHTNAHSSYIVQILYCLSHTNGKHCKLITALLFAQTWLILHKLDIAHCTEFILHRGHKEISTFAKLEHKATEMKGALGYQVWHSIRPFSQDPKLHCITIEGC